MLDVFGINCTHIDRMKKLAVFSKDTAWNDMPIGLAKRLFTTS